MGKSQASSTMEVGLLAADCVCSPRTGLVTMDEAVSTPFFPKSQTSWSRGPGKFEPQILSLAVWACDADKNNTG